MKTRRLDSLTRIDIAALLVFLAVWVYYAVTVRYGVCFADEPYYITVAERFVHGERPLVDEWQIAQLSSLFLCLPYRIYTALTGGTAGIVLFMRYLFLAFNAVVYWIMYVRLREYRWSALISTILFCIYVPFGIYACNYYVMTIRLLMLVCLLLFSEKQRLPSLWVAGVLLACTVLYHPGFAALYFGYSVLVLIRFFRQKRGKRFAESFAFCLHVRTWVHMSLGALVCAAGFLCWLVARSGIRNILTSVSYLLLTDPEYDYSAQGSAWGVLFRKLAEAARMYGSALLICALLVIALCVAYACGRFRTRRSEARELLFCLACVLWIISCIRTSLVMKAPTNDMVFVTYPAPLFWFGFVCFLLCEKKNTRLLFFWIVGLASSLCFDCFSDITLSIGCPIAYISVFVFLGDLAREMKADSASYRTQNRFGAAERIAVRTCAGVTCVCFAAWSLFSLFCLENPSFTAYRVSAVPLTADTVPCKDGPCRSLRYPEAYEQNYRNKMADIDSIRERHPKNLFICNISPEMYLYAGLPYAAFSSYSLGQTEYVNRQILYWKLYPEKQPECIFVPFDKVEFSPAAAKGLLSWIRKTFDPICEYKLETGKSGYILYVSQWRPETQSAH